MIVKERYFIPFCIKRALINTNGDILGFYFWDDNDFHVCYSEGCIIRDYGFRN